MGLLALIANDMFSVILYMSEIAPKKVRGALVAGYQFCITIGILLANCVVYATQNRDDTGSYRIVGIGEKPLPLIDCLGNFSQDNAPLLLKHSSLSNH